MAIAANNTQFIIQRGGLLPLLRYGNYSGPGYAGAVCARTVIEHPGINCGKPIAAGMLAQSPTGLASFMKLALQTEANGYIGSVTRMHDVEYTIAEIRFMQAVQGLFNGKLPHELTGQDRLERGYRQLEAACDAEYWQADQRMLGAIADYHPLDFADATYRELMLNAFYAKAESSIFGYGLKQQVQAFYNSLKAKDSQSGAPSFSWDCWSALGKASTMARADLEALITLPITPQERQFFNQHLTPGQYIDASTQDDAGNFMNAETLDFSNRIVVPGSVDGVIFTARVRIGRDHLVMTLDKTDKNHPIFTRVSLRHGELCSTQTIRTIDEGANKAVAGIGLCQEVIIDANGQILLTQLIPRPKVPALPMPADLQLKIDAVLSGDYRQVLRLAPGFTDGATNASALA